LKRFTFFLLVLLLSFWETGSAIAQRSAPLPDTLYYIGEKINRVDTAGYVNILKKFDWDITLVSKDGRTTQYLTKKPDTLSASAYIDTVYLSASFYVASHLPGQILAFSYKVDGSLLVQLNNETILASGYFSPGRSEKPNLHSENEFKNFIFKDTLQKLSVIYLPLHKTKMPDLSLRIYKVKAAEEKKTEIEKDKKESYGMGFYYLAFGIVFMILFIFFREKRENLYFSLFCIFAALSFLWDNLQTDILYNLDSFFGIFCFEFLAIFLSKILRNKEKSKIPLLVFILIMAICFVPYLRYASVALGDNPFPWILVSVFSLLYIYTLFSSFYYLIEGIGQKRWEAKTILIICLSPVLLLILLFIVFVVAYAVMGANDNINVLFSRYFNYFIRLIIYVYPLAAVFILGKRNGLNQKQLMAQVASIKKLSEENLATELEKKLLLENQKEMLEKEVIMRTAEVVTQKEEIEKQHGELKIEKRKSDDLLRNILPEEIAAELKEKGYSKARYFDNITVLFTDFVNFTQAGENMKPQALIDELHTCFKAFDEITGKYGIEKIKTIGDAYLAVAGLPAADPDHAENVVRAAIEISAFMADRHTNLAEKTFEVRIGIHSGSVVAGIVGVKKFAYDIWGDTVNTAARMEQNSEAGKINISQTTYELVKDKFACEYRGEIDAKGKGMLKMYFVVNRSYSES